MLDKKDLVIIRDSLPGDKNFIYSTWLRGLYYGDSWFQDIPKNIFMQNYHKVIEAILARRNVSVKVACLKDEPEVILGYSVCRLIDNKDILDYVFVKSAWRKIGIARSLVPVNLSAVTHLTKVGKALKPANCDFNPFLV